MTTYIVCLPDGRIAVSFQTDEDYSAPGDLPKGKSYTMKVIVSGGPVTAKSTAVTFSDADVPFETPEGKASIWNGMLITDDTLYACSGTSYPRTSIVIRRAEF